MLDKVANALKLFFTTTSLKAIVTRHGRHNFLQSMRNTSGCAVEVLRKLRQHGCTADICSSSPAACAATISASCSCPGNGSSAAAGNAAGGSSSGHAAATVCCASSLCTSSRLCGSSPGLRRLLDAVRSLPAGHFDPHHPHVLAWVRAGYQHPRRIRGTVALFRPAGKFRTPGDSGQDGSKNLRDRFARTTDLIRKSYGKAFRQDPLRPHSVHRIYDGGFHGAKAGVT